MHRAARFAPALLACLLPAATLERLSWDDMVQKSTAVVRGHIIEASASARSANNGRAGTIYTHYTVQVLERWKGPGAARIDVAVPGGTLQTRRQTFPGAPTLDLNADYVLFLWTSASGLTQIIGLSQGLMKVNADAGGNLVLSRSASQEVMVNSSGGQVTDSSFAESLGDFRARMKMYGMTGKN